MNILITGASGFVGTHLSAHFLEKGHTVTGLGRSRSHRFESNDRFSWISADTSRQGKWQQAVSNKDVIINLAGRTIFNFWTEKYKQTLYDSRILTTRHLVDAMEEGQKAVLLSASAIGYYGSRGDQNLTEADNQGDDFLSGVCVEWEGAATKASALKGARVALMRFGVILGKNGGALEKMVPAFNFFVGGPLGSGSQWFPWMHIKDLMAGVDFLIKDPEASGPFNFCAPGAIRQKTFAKALGKALGRPAFMPAPAFAVRTFMGEMGGALLGSQRAVPGKLVSGGFAFQFPDIDGALSDLVS